MKAEGFSVGVKYCGGCNPTYPREVVEKIIRESFPHFKFLYRFDADDVDLVVVICGCKTACVSLPEGVRQKAVVFDELLPSEEVRSKIREVLLLKTGETLGR